MGGIQPSSTGTADQLMDSAVSHTDGLMERLGGEWTFLDGQPDDAELVRSASHPQTCTTQNEDEDLVRGKDYSVVVMTEVPDEAPAATRNRLEQALESTGYEIVHSAVPRDDQAVATGRSAEGTVHISRKPGDLRIQLRTACSTHASLQ